MQSVRYTPFLPPKHPKWAVSRHFPAMEVTQGSTRLRTCNDVRPTQSTAINGLIAITMDALADRVAAAARVSAIAVGQLTSRVVRHRRQGRRGSEIAF